MYIDIDTGVRRKIGAYVPTRADICIHAHIYIYMHMCIYVCMYTHICLCRCVYTDTDLDNMFCNLM